MTVEEDAEQEVRISLFCSISMIVAPDTPTVLPLFTAEASVKVTVPKSAKGTSSQSPEEEHSEKSSTIHSALYSHSEPSDSPLKVCVTVVPVVKFSMTALPEVLEVAVTVIWMESPAEMEIPEKVSRGRVRTLASNRIVHCTPLMFTYMRNPDTTHTKRRKTRLCPQRTSRFRSEG